MEVSIPPHPSTSSPKLLTPRAPWRPTAARCPAASTRGPRACWGAGAWPTTGGPLYNRADMPGCSSWGAPSTAESSWMETWEIMVCFTVLLKGFGPCITVFCLNIPFWKIARLVKHSGLAGWFVTRQSPESNPEVTKRHPPTLEHRLPYLGAWYKHLFGGQRSGIQKVTVRKELETPKDHSKGKELGDHFAGGYVPWTLDILDGVLGERELLVLADNRFNATTAPMHTGSIQGLCCLGARVEVGFGLGNSWFQSASLDFCTSYSTITACDNYRMLEDLIFQGDGGIDQEASRKLLWCMVFRTSPFGHHKSKKMKANFQVWVFPTMRDAIVCHMTPFSRLDLTTKSWPVLDFYWACCYEHSIWVTCFFFKDPKEEVCLTGSCTLLRKGSMLIIYTTCLHSKSMTPKKGLWYKQRWWLLALWGTGAECLATWPSRQSGGWTSKQC